MRLVNLIRRQPQFLLIAPEGIEILQRHSDQLRRVVLLIAPEGIEIRLGSTN
jgi:hypothetical protein